MKHGHPKRLTLIRHAKSDWSHPQLSDFDRPLNKRGKHDAPLMGQLLKMKGVAFDYMLASPARRARKTAKLIAHETGLDKSRIRFDNDIYLATTSQLFEVLRGVEPCFGHVALVGHNPGLTELANLLGDCVIDNIPTCGIARFDLTIDRWEQFAPGCGKLLELLYPKMVGGEG